MRCHAGTGAVWLRALALSSRPKLGPASPIVASGCPCMWAVVWLLAAHPHTHPWADFGPYPLVCCFVYTLDFTRVQLDAPGPGTRPVAALGLVVELLGTAALDSTAPEGWAAAGRPGERAARWGWVGAAGAYELGTANIYQSCSQKVYQPCERG
jgi:hypothetical protein